MNITRTLTRKVHWSSYNSDRAARSSNVFFRVIGAYLDTQAGFKPCIGHRHWGVNGAAGLLPVHMTAKGLYVLLAKRAGWSQAGGTWSTFGGAIDGDETPWQAAIREASEEVDGITWDGRDGTGILLTTVADCPFGCGWSYTTFVVEVEPSDPRRVFLPSVRMPWGAHENSQLAWVPVHQVAGHGLHPELAKAWPGMLEVIAEPGSDDPSFYGDTEVNGLAQTFYYPPNVPRRTYRRPDDRLWSDSEPRLSGPRSPDSRPSLASWLYGTDYADMTEEDLADAFADAEEADARYQARERKCHSKWSAELWGEDPYAAS